MKETSETDARYVANWAGIGSDLNMAELDDPEGGRLNIQCLNSSEFVVGKQTNFNGPVTIINCAQAAALKGTNPEEKQEKVIIRDQVLSRSAAIILEEKAGKVYKDSGNSPESEKNLLQDWKLRIKSWILENMMVIPFGVFVFLAFSIGLTLAVVYLQQKVSPEEESEWACMGLKKIGRKACMYSMPQEAATRCENSKSDPLETPLSYVAISEIKGNLCYSAEDCLEILASADCEGGLGCNFLTGSDGNVYEVRGWNGGNTLRGSAAGKSLLVCLIGDFCGHYPTYPQMEATKALIAFGVENDFISSDYVLWAENATFADGDLNSVYRIIKKWPKFRRTPFSNEGESPVQRNDDQFFLYSKRDWGGKAASFVVEIKSPVPYVLVSHSVTSECSDLSSCSSVIQNMQSYHFSKNFADIAYNFLVDSGGHVYEGRGWTTRNSKEGFVNGRNINVCFIGDFSRNIKPTEEQFEGLRCFIDYGVGTGKISQDYSLISDNSTFATLSPGKNVYEVIKNWPHFDPNPKSNVKKYDY